MVIQRIRDALSFRRQTRQEVPHHGLHDQRRLMVRTVQHRNVLDQVDPEKPHGVPAENWLPMTREDLGIDVIMRVYVPDQEKMKTWKAPLAEIVN